MSPDQLGQHAIDRSNGQISPHGMQMVVDTVAVAKELQFEGWWTKHHLLSGIVKHLRSERDVTRDVRMSYTSGGRS